MAAQTTEQEQKQPPKIAGLPNPNDILGMADITGSNEIKKLLEAVLSDTDIEGKSELNRNQIVAFARAAWYADRYKSKSMQVLLTKLLKFLQSKDRAGKKELVSMFTGAVQFDMAQKAKEKVEL